MSRRLSAAIIRALVLALTLGTVAAAAPAPVIGAVPAVSFKYPTGAVQYRAQGSIRVEWYERNDPSIVRRYLVRHVGYLDANGGCATERFPTYVKYTVPASAVGRPDASGRRRATLTVSGHYANRCYRYRVRLIHRDGSLTGSGFSSAIRTVATWTGSYNLYRSSAFSTQRTWVWCIPASIQMMRNIITGGADHSSSNQSRYYSYARAHDRFDNWRFPGSDAQGWAAAMRYYTSVSHYGWHATYSYRDALRYAAKQLRRTGKPVGLMVARGGHAWVMTGFRATADPAVTDSYEVTDVYISGPLYPIQQSSSGYDRRPNTRYSYSYLRRFFVPFRSLPNENSELWANKFITITP
jgi:hypothetical protein